MSLAVLVAATEAVVSAAAAVESASEVVVVFVVTVGVAVSAWVVWGWSAKPDKTTPANKAELMVHFFCMMTLLTFN
jgi:hypothetical protein